MLDVLVANEFDVRNVLHGQVSLAVVKQIYVIHEAMNLQKTKDSLKACFGNVNIIYNSILVTLVYKYERRNVFHISGAHSVMPPLKSTTILYCSRMHPGSNPYIQEIATKIVIIIIIITNTANYYLLLPTSVFYSLTNLNN